MFNQSGVIAADVSTGDAARGPDISRRNSTDAVQYSGSASIWAGDYLPGGTVPVFDDCAAPKLHSDCPNVVGRKRRGGEKRGGRCGDPSPMLPVEMGGERL